LTTKEKSGNQHKKIKSIRSNSMLAMLLTLIPATALADLRSRTFSQAEK